MNLIYAILIFAVVAWLLVKLKIIKIVPDEAPPQEQKQDRSDPAKQAKEALVAAVGACLQDHPHAFPALAWLSAADGTVSQQEMRLIFRFCAKHGTVIPEAAIDAIPFLNSSVHLTLRGTETDAHETIAALREAPTAYKVSFYGAANAICGTKKTVGKAKTLFLQKAESMIGG